MVESGPFDGTWSVEGRDRVADWLEQRGIGRRKVNYRLRDWLISRQRYWGAPIPIVYCDRCGTVPVPKENLPVLLPSEVDFSPGSSPLSRCDEFVRTTCPSCGSQARRETDTMDTFVCSSWYYYRYTSPDEESAPFSTNEANSWMPVDQYVGGVEHAVLHLLYSRFFTKVLYDAGLIDVEEPFTNLLSQGMVTRDGAAMSSSKGNVVPPEPVLERHGADAARLYMLFAAPPEKDMEWTGAGLEGAGRFLSRVWRFVEQRAGDIERWVGSGRPRPRLGELDGVSLELYRALNETVKKVTEDISERFGFNTAISAMMELVNALYRDADSVEDERLVPLCAETLLLLLAPFAPYMTEELWERTGHRGSVHLAEWPGHEEAALRREEVTVVVQVEGKVRERLVLPAGSTEDEAREAALASKNVQRHVAGREVERTVWVPDRLLNVVLR